MTAHDPRLDALNAETTVVIAAAEATEQQERRLAARILGIAGIGVALWAAAVAAFGWAGLILPAVAAVPAIFLWLVLLTRG